MRDKNKLKNVIILTNVLAPYRYPLFEALSDACNLTVLICNHIEENRRWNLPYPKFRVKSLRGIKFKYSFRSEEPKYIYMMFEVVLYAFKPNCRFIIGDASWTSFILAFVLVIFGRKYDCWTEHTFPSPARRGLIGWLRKLTILNARYVYVPGYQSQKYLNKIIGRFDNITLLKNTAEAVYYDKPLQFNRHHDKSKVQLLYVGQLIKRKGVERLLSAIDICKSNNIDIKLDIVGEGPLKLKIQNEYPDNVKFLGNLNSDELVEQYERYDALVLLSMWEPWGIVINEALLRGTPCIVSENVGAKDLINYKNGLIVPDSLDDFQLAEQIQTFSKRRFDRQRIREQQLQTSPVSVARDILLKQ